MGHSWKAMQTTLTNICGIEMAEEQKKRNDKSLQSLLSFKDQSFAIFFNL